MRAANGGVRLRGSRRRALAFGALLLVAGGLLSACGSARRYQRIALPAETRLYVAVFVDETPEGRVGLPLSEAVRVEVYRRDPPRLAIGFDEGTWALDGTVLALEEQPDGDGRVTLTVRVSARLLEKGGAVVARLGELAASARYRVGGSEEATLERREKALETAVRDLAREIVRRVERAGDTPTLTEVEGEGDEG